MEKFTASLLESSSMAIQFGTIGPMDLHPENVIDSNPPPPPPPQPFPDLLPEIITEILSRLPVKSLLQFRSVSKSWRSIIDDPKFIKTHLNICSKNGEIAHHRLIFVSFYRGPNIAETCHLSSVFNVVSVNPTELDYPLMHQDSMPYIVGSVNGLICVNVHRYKSREKFFWNPSTRILKKLPHSGFDDTTCSCYGFGYDESADDYKLVGVFDRMGTEFLGIVMVYSLRTDCWRRIGDFPSRGRPLGKMGMFVNGAVHWFVCSPQNKSIVSLDLAKETYGEVALPSYGDGKFELKLGVLGECLSVLCGYDVWMMKEYGVRESWTKLGRIPYNANYGDDEYMFPSLLYISNNGEILLRMGARVVVYDTKTNSLRHTPDIHNIHRTCIGACVYIESLVSPLIQ